MPNHTKTPLTILLFEDNQHDANLVTEYLKIAGITAPLRCVNRLQEGLQFLETESYDIILLDLSLPDSRGIPTLLPIVSKAKNTAIIVLTGSEDEVLSLEALKMGAQDYLEKDTLNPNTLSRSIRYSLERSKLLKNSEAHANETIKREKTLQKVFDANSEAMLILSKDFKIKTLNTSAAKLLDAEKESLFGETFPFHFNHSEISEIEIPTANNTTRVVELNPTELTWGEDSNQLLVLHDITALREAEEKIKGQDLRFSQVINSISEAIVTTDKNGNIIQFNRSFSELCSTDKNSISGKSIEEVIAIFDRNQLSFLKNFPASLISERTGEALPETNVLLKQKDKLKRKISIKAHKIENQDATALSYLITIKKLEKEKLSEEEAYQAEKLHSISLLAGGIAHDFNNMLTAIIGNISVVTHELEAENPISQKLLAAEKAAFQAKRLTQQLLTFSKGGSPALETTTIDQLVEDCAEFILRGSNVKCHVSKSDPVWAVNADKGQIAQVINNLLINADQAMPNGGMIELNISNYVATHEQKLALTRGDYVQISITDSGIGIEAADIHRIFDPYFTTKQTGNGLGLASSYSIIKSHKGLLTVKSSPGNGACFEIYLPRSFKALEVKEPKAEYNSQIQKGTGRILVMDDMDAMMRVAGEIISLLGYEVEFSTNGDEAIKAYKEAKEKGQKFDAVVFDLTVPGGMGGEEACNILKQYDPDIKAIASSGYSTSNIMSDHRDSPFKAVVPKPYRIKEMSLALHSLLGT